MHLWENLKDEKKKKKILNSQNIICKNIQDINIFVRHP